MLQKKSGCLRRWTALVFVCFAVALSALVKEAKSVKDASPFALHLDSFLRDEAHSSEKKGDKWAVLVAGSNNWWNYRHQADVCHSYQILKKNGFPDDNIIVMRYDDLEFNINNPIPGTVINKPECLPTKRDDSGAWAVREGCNVNEDCRRDYWGAAVSPENFISVLTGDAETAAMSCVEGNLCNGKVLNSTAEDHVFVAFFDHGGTHLLGFPSAKAWGPARFIRASQVIDALSFMHDHSMYKKMIFYIEACESGSIFNGLLPENISIWATTASDPFHSSFATYCGESISGQPLPCLGDLYSVDWMEDVETHSMESETWKKDFKRVEKETNASQVCAYGDMDLASDTISKYLEYIKRNDSSPEDGKLSTTLGLDESQNKLSDGVSKVSSRDAKMHFLEEAVKQANVSSSLKLEYVREIEHRKEVDNQIKKILTKLSEVSPVETGLVVSEFYQIHVPKLCHVQPTRASYDETYFSCLGELISLLDGCLTNGFSEYSMRYVKLFSSICSSGIGSEKYNGAFNLACSNKQQL